MTLEAVQWIALGLGMVNRPFADLIYRHVWHDAFRGFGLVEDVKDQLEVANVARIRQMLGLRPDGELSSAIISYLSAEGILRYKFRTRQPCYGRARALAKIIEDATRELMAMARHENEYAIIGKMPCEFEDGDGI